MQIRQPGGGAWDEARYVATYRVPAGAGFDAHEHGAAFRRVLGQPPSTYLG